MLREIAAVRQHPGEPRRRWFSDERMDLIVWLDRRGAIVAFQLCYDRDHGEHAVTWQRGAGSRHDAVDDGEHPGRHKATPILVADGPFPAHRVRRELARRGRELDADLLAFVLARVAPGRAPPDEPGP